MYAVEPGKSHSTSHGNLKDGDIVLLSFHMQHHRLSRKQQVYM